jgi:IS4 transposase
MKMQIWTFTKTFFHRKILSQYSNNADLKLAPARYPIWYSQQQQKEMLCKERTFLAKLELSSPSGELVFV